jgi:hypothetical protein
MSLAHVIWHYQDAQGAPLAGVKLDAASTNGDWHGFTDSEGNFESDLGAGIYLVTASKAGFQTDVLPALIGLDGTINRALQVAVSPVYLRIEGRYFVNPDGSRKPLIGTDVFLAYRQFLDGVDLTPFFEESKALGFNMWRVFFQGSKAQNGVLQLSPTEPGYYDHVRPFADLLNANGIALLATIGVDNQDIKSPVAHWGHMADLLRGSGTLFSFGNEWSKNGFDPGAIPAPSGLLWSRGSDLQDKAPYKPAGSFMEFHPVRNYTTAMRDAVASPIELFEVQGYTAALLFDEIGRMGSVDPSPAEFAIPSKCYEYARIASTLCAGVVFHNRAGQSGRLMEEGTKACAREFVRGMTL